MASDVTLVCSGNDACKGSSGLIDCGYGDCRVDCHGQTDCEDLEIRPGAAQSFICYGFCPANRPRDYTNSPTKSPTQLTILNRDEKPVPCSTYFVPPTFGEMEPNLFPEPFKSMFNFSVNQPLHIHSDHLVI